jgi:hypothetical protein
VSDPFPQDTDLQPYYRASRTQLLKIYGLTGFSVLWFAGMAWLAHLAFHHMHAEGTPDVLAGFGDRLGMSLFILAAGLAFPAGMWIYLTCYVFRAWFSSRHGIMIYQTLNPIGKRIWLDGEGAENMVLHEGKLDLTGGLSHPSFIVPRVHAPWLSSRVSGKRFPLIIDAMGEFCWNQTSPKSTP